MCTWVVVVVSLDAAAQLGVRLSPRREASPRSAYVPSGHNLQVCSFVGASVYCGGAEGGIMQNEGGKEQKEHRIL